jgi:hypothetical protein
VKGSNWNLASPVRFSWFSFAHFALSARIAGTGPLILNQFGLPGPKISPAQHNASRAVALGRIHPWSYMGMTRKTQKLKTALLIILAFHARAFARQAAGNRRRSGLLRAVAVFERGRN